jgi:bifunctional UDP-N-acetylglucosamine pyrophosphorylase / glucosamine-1-phosphate N-acetyltransferase
MSQTKLNVVILAAGLGTRMNSQRPKVLHQIAGKALLEHVIDTAISLLPAQIVIVYGSGGDQVRSFVDQKYPNNNFIWAKQDQQLGTGDAMQAGIKGLQDFDANNPSSTYNSFTDTKTLILYGDVPLLKTQTLSQMLELYNDDIVMLTANVDNPHGYGRILREGDTCKILGICEEADATIQQRQITEINSGIYLINTKHLSQWLQLMQPHQINKNGTIKIEYYLTDIIEWAVQKAINVAAVVLADALEVSGVNNKLQLQQLERYYQQNKANHLMQCGVTLADSSRLDVRGELITGKDCYIDVNCVFSGKVTLGNNVTIAAGCIIADSVIADNVEIKPYSVIEGANIASGCKVGPFARVRVGSRFAENVHIGNFVEVKNTSMGSGSKANHLTYLGDSQIGSKVNIGAGSVTCNYDGVNKWKTTIEDNVFIGSGTMMVAPVTIAQGGVVGAGSTITKDTEANELTVARSKQVTIFGWLRRKK